MLLGAVVCLAWIFDIAWIKTLAVGLSAMKMNTAIGIISLSVSVWLMAHEQPTGFRLAAAWAGAGVAGVVGAATIVEYAFRCDLGIDQLLVHDYTATHPLGWPGRMGLNSASCLVLLSAATIVSRRQRLVSASQLAALTALVIALVTLAGYAFSARAMPFFGLPFVTPMALHTALCMIMLATAVLCLRGDAGPIRQFTSTDLGGSLARYMLPAAVAAVAATTLVVLLLMRHGYLDSVWSSALMVVGNAIIFSAIIWFTAAKLNQLDRDRRHAKAAEAALSQELKEYARDLESSVERFQLALQAARMGNWDWDLEHNTPIVWSPQMEKVYGVETSTFDGAFASFRERIHPDDRERVVQTVNEALYGPQASSLYYCEYRIVWPDGSVHWVESRGLIKRNAQRAPTRITGVVVDITDRKEAEAALSQSEQRFRSLVEESPVGVWQIAADGSTIQYLNPALRRMLDIPLDEDFVGLKIVEFIAPSSRKLSDSQMELRRRGLASSYEVNYLTRQRRQVPVLVFGSPVMGRDGQLSGMVGMSVDITERKQAEEKAQRYLADLSRIDRINTAGEMASSLAHELNQPLTAISVQAAVAQELANDDTSASRGELNQALLEVAQQSKRAGEIIRVLRNLIRKGEPVHLAHYVNDVVLEVLGLVELRAREARIRVERNLGAISPISCDRAQMAQLLLNLCQNAIDAMSPAELATRVMSITTSMIDDKHVQVEVRDTGVGIAPEVQAKIFDSFFSTKPGGIGMGLAICQSVVEAHGGKLWATSHAGGGASFYVKLPVA